MLVALGFGFDFAVQTRNSSNNVAAPDSAPTWKCYDGSGTSLDSGTMTGPVDSETGFYMDEVGTLNVGFERGQTYWIRIEWSVSSAAKAQLIPFTVV
jgi:hypothetical protein